MDDLEYGLHIYEFKYPLNNIDSSEKIFKITLIDFKKSKMFCGTLGDRLQLKDYYFDLSDIKYNLIPISQDVFFKLLNTYADEIIGKNKKELFNLIDCQEWLI